MTTSETYNPIPFSTADLRRLKKAFQDHAPAAELDLGHSDTGISFVTVTDPRAGFDDAPPCITRGERGWQMHRGGNGPLYEFASEQAVVDFFRVAETHDIEREPIRKSGLAACPIVISSRPSHLNVKRSPCVGWRRWRISYMTIKAFVSLGSSTGTFSVRLAVGGLPRSARGISSR